MSQSPEGSTIDFHITKRWIVFRQSGTCLNPPKGPPSISTRCLHCRPRKKFPPCLNPPKGPPSISTPKGSPCTMSWCMSQSPEGSTIDFHGDYPDCRVYINMSQSPEGSTIDFHVERLRSSASGTLKDVSIPRRVHHRFPPSTLRFHQRLHCIAVSQSPEGSTIDFHYVYNHTDETTQILSQSPEGSTIDFHWALRFTFRLISVDSVSIPRRVHHRFPPATSVCLNNGRFRVSIPRRVHHRFPQLGK